MPDEEDEECPATGVGGVHCDCWWDGERCHYCDAPPMSDESKRAKGMIDA